MRRKLDDSSEQINLKKPAAVIGDGQFYASFTLLQALLIFYVSYFFTQSV